MRFFATVVVVGFVFAQSSAEFSHGQSVPVVDIDPGTQIGDPPTDDQFEGFKLTGFTMAQGWSFDVLEPLPVTAVAWFDENGDGLSHEHQIDFWTDKGVGGGWESISTTTIPDGTEADLVGPWRTVEIPTLLLQPGSYFLASDDDGELTDSVFFVTPGSRTLPDPVDPRISMFAAGSGTGPNFGPPFLTVLVPSVALGPNFFVAPVPEPSTLALLVSGMLVVVVRARRRA